MPGDGGDITTLQVAAIMQGSGSVSGTRPINWQDVGPVSAEGHCGCPWVWAKKNLSMCFDVMRPAFKCPGLNPREE